MSQDIKNQIEVLKISFVSNEEPIKAFVDISIAGIIIKGFTIKEKSDGLVIVWPSEFEEIITELILKAYEA